MSLDTSTFTQRSVLLTRAQSQMQELSRMFSTKGAKVIEFPTLLIKPLIPPKLPKNEILKHAERVIFISSNAVEYGFPLIKPYLNEETALFAIGKTTAMKLSEISHRAVSYPLEEQVDSESLLRMANWQEVAGQRVIICRGVGGREWLKEELERRGALVDYLECYIRALPEANLSTLDNAIESQAVILIMSKDALTNLWQLAGVARVGQLKNLPFLVCHPRIQDYARELGIHRVDLTDNNNQAIVDTWMRLYAS